MRMGTYRLPATFPGLLAALACLLLVASAGFPLASGATTGTRAVLPTSIDGRTTSPTPGLAPDGLLRAGPPPAAGATLTSAGQSPAAIGLEWADATSGTFTNYTVLGADRASAWAYSTYAVITNAGTTSFVVSGLSPGTDYSWEVQENYETCLLVICTPESALTNAVNATQPAVAYLNDTAVTSTSATLEWTNNATYGSLISFVGYTVWEQFNGGSAAQIDSITTQSERSYTATLASGESYSFFVKTSDCVGECGGDDQALSETQSNLITLGTPLTLSVSIFAEHTTIDLGQLDFFTCTPTGGKSPFSYSWDFGTGSYVAGNATESATLGSEGVQAVTCEITDAEPEEAAQSVQVQVNPPLEVTVSKNRSAADVGEAVAFTCSASNGTVPYSINWEFGDGSTSPLSTPSHDYAAAGNYAPTCTVEDGAGVGEAPSLPIVISPGLQVTAFASSVAAAPGTSLTFTADPANGSGDYVAYNWSFGPGTTASGAQVQHAFPGAEDPEVSVVVTDSNGATAVGTVTVVVSPVAVSVAPVPTTIAAGKSVTFKATASGGAGGPYNYTWNLGNGHRGYGASITYAYASTGRVSPSLQVTDRLGATNTSTLPSIEVTAAPSLFSWFTWWVALGIAVALAAVVAVLVFARRRRDESQRLQKAASPYVPPTDPKQTIWGSKTCAFCGGSNLPIRTTCRICGKILPRNPET
jgi:hypothetical protein